MSIFTSVYAPVKGFDSLNPLGRPPHSTDRIHLHQILLLKALVKIVKRLVTRTSEQWGSVCLN
jgi:hypothetical protein